MKKNYLEIHFFRIIACLMVIIIHTTATPVISLKSNSIQQLIFIILNRFSKPSVPMFIFMSGFLLNMLYATQSLNPISFWKKRLPKLLIPYILWATLYYILHVIEGNYPLEASFYIKGLLQGNFTYHLYFMIIIVQFYVFYPLFHQIQKKIGTRALFILAIVIQIALFFVPLPLQDRLLTTYISYFALGMLMNVVQTDTLKSPLHYFTVFILAGSFYTYQFIQYTNNHLMIKPHLVSLTYMMFSLVACYALLMTFKSFRSFFLHFPNQIQFLSQSTLVLYYAHPLILMLMEYLLDVSSILSISLRAFLSFGGIFIILLPVIGLYTHLLRSLQHSKFSKM